MEAKKILIADDEARLRKLIADFLKKEGFQIIEAQDGAEALELFTSESKIDLVILDVMMPKYDGWVVCHQIRKSSSVPIVMLTAKSEESDQLFGFEIGADEYIRKPFSPSILVARVKALLRRAENFSPNKSILTYHGLVIDKKRHSVLVDGEAVELSPKEYELLVYLVENQGVALNRDQILNSVWDYDYFGDARTVDTHIKKLRMKLKDKGRYLQTVRGYGYRFEVLQ
ncbi:MAG: response regulator transcription factor [Bacteroidota bacterium]